jgi:hypothetical protein
MVSNLPMRNKFQHSKTRSLSSHANFHPSSKHFDIDKLKEESKKIVDSRIYLHQEEQIDELKKRGRRKKKIFGQEFNPKQSN